jgi:hypothetical protein
VTGIDRDRIRADLEHAAWERIALSSTRHVPRVAVCIGPGSHVDFRLSECSCGWTAGDADPADDAIAAHAAIASLRCAAPGAPETLATSS